MYNLLEDKEHKKFWNKYSLLLQKVMY